MSNPETCQNCRYWQPDPLRHRGDYPRPIGLCRKAPPTSSMELWPITALHDWCGAYEEGRPVRLYLGTIVFRDKYGHEGTDIIGPFRLEEDAAEAVMTELRRGANGHVVGAPATSTQEQEWFRVVRDEGLPPRLEPIPMDDDDPVPHWDAMGEVFSREVK